MQNLMYLKARSKKNPSYFGDYMKFTNDLIAKDYIKKEDTRPPGKTWFILDHGLYHPRKPKKIRVVLIALQNLMNNH